MPVNVLFAANPDNWQTYRPALHAAFDANDLHVNLGTDITPSEVDYIVYAPNGPVADFSVFTRARAVLSLWAGVEKVVTNTTLTIPLARMVDTGLTQGMVEWVCGHVLRHHLGTDASVCDQSGHWKPVVPPLAGDRRVLILGLGALGSACAQALAGLGFSVMGWSRSEKTINGIACLTGSAGLNTALRAADIVVLLLPATGDTDNMINAETLALLHKDAVIINPGRGTLIDDDALLDALDNERLAHATLDVFRIEPLPEKHPFWAHPRVTVTPHIASETRPASAARTIAQNIARAEQGLPLLHLVDRANGY